MAYSAEKEFGLIKNDIANIKDMDSPSEDVWINAIKKDYTAFHYVKEQTKAVCLEVVKQNGYMLEHVKEQTPEICLEAVKSRGLALEYVKEQTEEICLEAIKISPYALEYVKEQTEKICLEAVKGAGINLEHVKNPTYEICLEAVKNDGSALEFVKEQTPELCLEAVRQNGLALGFVESKTYELCLEAIKDEGHAIHCVDEITDELSFYALLSSRDVEMYNKNNGIEDRAIRFMSNNPVFEKKVLFLRDRNYSSKIEKMNYQNNEYHQILKEMSLEECEFVAVDCKSLELVSEFLIKSNSGNYFIVTDALKIDDEIIKSISISNNSLIVIQEEGEPVKDIHRNLANKIVYTQYKDTLFRHYRLS